MRVGIIEAHNGYSTTRLDEGQQFRPVRLFVGRRHGRKREREARVKALGAEPIHGPLGDLRDQRQFIAIEIEGLELLGAEAVLHKVRRQGRATSSSPCSFFWRSSGHSHRTALTVAKRPHKPLSSPCDQGRRLVPLTECSLHLAGDAAFCAAGQSYELRLIRPAWLAWATS